MIELLKEPAVCSLSKNDMLFKIKSNQIFGTPTVFPKIRLQFSHAFTAGTYFEFAFLNPDTSAKETIHFRAIYQLNDRAENDVLGYLTSPTVAGANLNTFTLDLIADLRKIKALNAFYTIEFIDNGIIDIIAKKAQDYFVPTDVVSNIDEGFLITFSSTISSSYNEAQEREGYICQALIFINTKGSDDVFEHLTTLDVALDGDAIGYVDVSEPLNGKIEADWDSYPVPLLGTENPEFLFKTENLRKYYVLFKESWAGQASDFTKKSSDLFVHWGGIGTDDQLRDEPINQVLSFDSFLTWIPDKKKNHKDQLDFLYFMNGGLSVNYGIDLTITTNQGTHNTKLINTDTGIFFPLYAFETIGFYSNIQFYIDHPAVLQTPWTLAADEVIKTYQFRIFRVAPDGSGTNPFLTDPIQSFTYLVEEDCNKKFVLYVNPFGVLESFSTNSTWLEKINISSELATRGLAYNNDVLRSRNFIFNIDSQNSIEIESSLLTREVARRLQTMLISTYTFIVENERLMPVVMNIKGAEFWNNSERIMFLKFELLKANNNDRISFMKTAPSISYQRNAYQDVFSINGNGIEIDSATSLKLYKDRRLPNANLNLLEKELVFDSPTKSWFTGVNATNWHTDGLEEGDYYYTTEITDVYGNTYDLAGVVQIRWQTLILYFKELGMPELFMTPTPATLTAVYIGINFSVDTNDLTFFNITGSVNLAAAVNYTIDKTKKVFIKAPTFDDVWFFSILQNKFYCDNIDQLNKLSSLAITGLEQSQIFLNNFQEIDSVVLTDGTLKEVYVGFLPKLTSITLNNLQLDADALESFIRELYNFRKMYGAVSLFLTDMVTANSETSAMINGTGIYGGDGLIQNGFSVTITP